MSTRISKPKVRSGCLTCKLRRVKCDETKPECIRCINYWGSCDGYANSVTKASTGAITRPNILLPRIQPRIGPLFESEQDLRYFEIFRNETAASLGGPFDSYVWERIIPQACAQERFVQDAVIAIGALTNTMYEIQRYRRLRIAPKIGQRRLGSLPDHVHAIALYGRSLKGMRKASLAEDKDIRMALIACLLVVCFEGFHGSQKEAMTHAAHGVKLLRGWREKHGGPKSLLKSPAPQVIEDELIHVFSRLDLQVLTSAERSLEYHKGSLQENEPIEGMPFVFLSLRQARAYWDHIMRRICHFLASTVRASKADELEDPERRWPREEVVEFPAEVSYISPKKILQRFKAQSDVHMEEISQWEKAFEPLFQTFQQQHQQQQQQQQSNSSPPPSSPSPNPRSILGYVGSIIIKISGLTTSILLTSCFFTDELSNDQLLPIFRSVYILVSSIYKPLTTFNTRHTTTDDNDNDNDNNNVSYHFDAAVLPALFLLVTRCRHRALRRAAIRLLNSSFHREGKWDSLALARVGAWFVGVEERGLVFGDGVGESGRDGQAGESGDDEFAEESIVIPDHRRARITRFHVDLREQKAHVQCFQRENVDDQDVVWLETELRW